jgi:hypothetical protein
MKILFLPISIGNGVVAGMLARKLFDVMWGLIDDEEPPAPEHREITWRRLVLALAIQGALFRVVRGTIDRAMRKGYLALTGAWPGEERPERT